MTAQPDTATQGRPDALLAELISVLDRAGDGVPEVTAGAEEPLLTWSGPNGEPATTVTVTTELADLLDRIARFGVAAGRARDSLAQHRRIQAEQTRDQARDDTRARYENAGAAVFGLIEAGDGWQLPPGRLEADVRVQRVPAGPDSFHRPGPVARLEVTTRDGLPLGHVEIDVDEQITSIGAYARQRFPRAESEGRALESRSPWTGWTQPARTASVAEHVFELAEVGLGATDWIRRMEAVLAERDRAARARADEAAEWARLSRSKDRIPTKALTDWMREASNIEYDSTGYAISGWRVVAQSVSGRRRPTHLERAAAGRRGPVGVREVLYVARIVHERVSFRDGWLPGFHDSQIERLRQALPGCVVKVPEDRKALFVAFDAPEHRQVLDAAIAEWVLTGAGDV